MLLIKRYPNRKLYDTQARRYITLDELGELIRQGEDVKVVDHARSQDITAVVLTQIILEREKRRGGFLPRTLLTELVQTGGYTLRTLGRALIPPMDIADRVDQAIEERLQSLLEGGEATEEEVQRMRALLLPEVQPDWPDEQEIESALQRSLQRHGVASRGDLQKLIDQIEALEARLDSIDPSSRE